MARHLDWEGARRREAGENSRPDGAVRRRKRKGITNAQAKYLAHLCRKNGIPYTGQGMSCAAASQMISRLTGERDTHHTPGTHPWERHTQ